jgi:uncharacterized protein
VLVLLPPSETKAGGGSLGPLDLDALSFPELTPVRRKLADALAGLAADVPTSLAALGLSPRQKAEVHRNGALFTSPTAPALARYTGVLYDALEVGTLTKTQLARCYSRLAVASALFGVVRGDDPIPAYRLSGGSVLPGIGPLRGAWRPELEPVLTGVDDLVVDLRSGAYSALARVPAAVVVRVITSEGKAVSHHNKAAKGRFARALATATREPSTVSDLVKVARGAGMVVEPADDRCLDLVVTD